MLSRLKLTAIRDQLDTLLDEAARRELTLREAPAFLCQREVARKDEQTPPPNPHPAVHPRGPTGTSHDDSLRRFRGEERPGFQLTQLAQFEVGFSFFGWPG